MGAQLHPITPFHELPRSVLYHLLISVHKICVDTVVMGKSQFLGTVA